MTRKKIIILTLSLLFILTAFNYGPMFYRRLTGNGGTWVEFYHYTTKSDELLADILAFKRKNKQLWPPNDTNLCVDNVGSMYVKFYEAGKYYHVWVQSAVLILGGVSTTPKYHDAKLINRDMDFLTRQRTIKHFKTIILDNLAFKTVDT